MIILPKDGFIASLAQLAYRKSPGRAFRYGFYTLLTKQFCLAFPKK
jgi:hypothetical protein